jgi:hypothetical protein
MANNAACLKILECKCNYRIDNRYGEDTFCRIITVATDIKGEYRCIRQ